MRKVIVDCDTGHDDIMAILSLLAHPDEIDVLGFTTVCGNNLMPRVTDNLCRVLSYLNIDKKVACGYDSPLVLDPEPQDAHGESGLDGPVLPCSKLKPIDLKAVEFIKEMALEHDKITIVALAPLTNIAMFIKTFPELKNKIECITLMGGSRSSGNILKRSEFNFYGDPHSADIVFRSNIPVIMSDIEICAECSTSHKIIELFITRKCQVDIELDGKCTRGMSVVSEGDNCLLIEHLKDNTLYNNYFLEDLNILERNNSGN